MNELKRLLRSIAFYNYALIVVYLNIFLLLLGPLSAFGTQGGDFAPPSWLVGWYFVAFYATIPVSLFAVALMVLALNIIYRVAKRYPEFKTFALTGGISAAAYPVLSILFWVAATARGHGFGGIESPTVFFVFNPVTLGLALLVVHLVVIAKAREFLKASPEAPAPAHSEE